MDVVTKSFEGRDRSTRGPPFLFFLALIAPAAEISGTIYDPSGQPISRAAIRASGRDGSTFTATADEQGRYRMGDLPPGTYLIEAGTRGLASKATRAVTVSATEAVTADIHVDLLKVVERVTVTAENAPLSIDEAA